MWMLAFVARILLRKKAVKLLNKKICKTFSKLSEYKGLIISACSSEIVAYGLRFGGFDISYMEKQIDMRK